jgi:hypothetical protein
MIVLDFTLEYVNPALEFPLPSASLYSCSTPAIIAAFSEDIKKAVTMKFSPESNQQKNPFN